MARVTATVVALPMLADAAIDVAPYGALVSDQRRRCAKFVVCVCLEVNPDMSTGSESAAMWEVCTIHASVVKPDSAG